MTNPFDSSNYRRFLAEKAQLLKTEQPGFTLGKLAQESGIQPPYLTNVFKEKAHLSADQLFALMELMGLGEDEQRYLSLLLEWERSDVPLRKKRLKAQVEQLRAEQRAPKPTSEMLESQQQVQFLLNPYYEILHSFLAVDEFAQNPQKIADSLHQSRQQIDQWLKDLVDMNFARRTSKGYEKIHRLKVTEDSPFSDPHQNLMRRMADQHQMTLPKSEKFNASLNFVATDSAREKVQSEFEKFLKSVEDVVSDSPSNEVYGLSFDLFKWSFDPKKSGGRS